MMSFNHIKKRASSRYYFTSHENAIPHPITVGGAIVVAAFAMSALVNRLAAKKAERKNPPMGRFVEVEDVRLHYFECGEGEPLVLLHGNGSMIQDFLSSGLVDKAAGKYRVIAFDRPGFGYSERPRRTSWTPDAQANLIRKALQEIGISRAIVFGHSWGASVAVALALKDPEVVAGLILASGYYYPTVRGDMVLLSGSAIPGIGDILSHTLSPILGRLMWPLAMRKLFGPSPVPKKFDGFPKEMALRPSQVRASAAEWALMTPGTLRKDYARLTMPVALIAGEGDRLIDIDKQSARLHREITHSTLRCVPNVGHMVHQTATDLVMGAIDEVADKQESRPDPVIGEKISRSAEYLNSK